MRLLTWHGTIIRLETATGRLTHAALVPTRDLAADFILALPPEGLTAPLAGPNEITLVPGATDGIAHLQRRGLFLSVRHAAYPEFAAERAGAPEALVLMQDEDIALLRDLLTHAWTRADTGQVLRPGEMTITPGPRLAAGGLDVPLGARGIRRGESPDTLTIALGEDDLTLTRVPDSRAHAREILLRRQGAAATPEVADAAVFATKSPARLSVPAAAEFAIPPILGSLADRDFLYRRGAAPSCGRLHLTSQVVRARAKYVLLGEGVEGMILDEDGVLNGAACVEHLGDSLPAYFAREGGQYFIDRALLDSAPVLSGPHAVFYGCGAQDYDRWLVGAMVPLSLLEPYLPADATLLLPQAAGRTRARPAARLDHLALLDAFGFGGMKRLEMAGPICRVEELFWPDRCAIDQLPAVALRAARERVLTRLPPIPRARARLYVHREAKQGVANPHVANSVLEKLGFKSVVTEDLTVPEQIDLFRRAEMVVAPHGAALANLMFCPPGTQVIELSPEYEYRPVYSQISAKLGLTHAVLPCATDDGTFGGRLVVPGARLNTLLGLLMSRLAA